MTCGFGVNTTLGEIGVRAIDVAERKRQRLVAAARSGFVRMLYFGLADGRGNWLWHREPVLKL
jgi:hypothetical protein